MATKSLKILRLLSALLLFSAGGCFCIHASEGMGAEEARKAGGTDLAGDSTARGHRLRELSVTARRSPSRLTGAVAVQAMDRKQFEELGITGLADAVKRFAGVNVRDYGGLGGLKTVSVRNMGATHTAVSYDGIPLSNLLGGQIDIGRFSLFDISMVTLSAGSETDMLQPASLVKAAAVLGLNTLTPSFTEGRRNRFDAEISGGSFGYIAPALRWSHSESERVSTSLAVSAQHTDGNYPFTLVNGRLVTRERRANSALTSGQAEGNLYWQINHTTQLHAKGYAYHSERGLPGAVTLYNPHSAEKLWDTDIFGQVKLRHENAEHFDYQLIARYAYGSNIDRDRGAQYADGVRTDRFRQQEFYLSGSVAYHLTPRLSVALAQDEALGMLWTNLASCPYPIRYTSTTAFSGRYATARLKLDAAVTLTEMEERVESGDAPHPFRRVAPWGGVNWRVWSDRTVFVRAMSKSTFRVPTFNDLYYDRVGTRTLRPEKALENSVGLTWSHTSLGPLTGITLTADGYFNRVTDKIVAVPTTFVWKMYNFGRVNIYGIDITATSGIALRRGWNLDLTGNFTWQRAVDVTDRSALTYGHRLPYTPSLYGNASATLRTPWLTVGYTVNCVGARYNLAQNIAANRMAPYSEQNVTLSREIEWRGARLTLSAEMLNLADVQYDVIRYYPMPGRSLRAGAKIRF